MSRRAPTALDDVKARMAAILAVPKAEVDALEAERPKRGQLKPKPTKLKGDKKKGAA